MPHDQNIKRLTREEIREVFALYSARRLGEALAAANRLLQQHPGEAVLLNILGAIHAGLGQTEAAITSYEQALQIRPDVAEAHFHLGNSLLESGRVDAALASFEQALLLNPNFVEAHGKLCQGLERASRLEDLAEALGRAKAQCPGNHPALALREAELLKRRGKYAAARALLETAEEAADAETLEASKYLLGDLCDRLGDTAAAFRYVQQGNQLCQKSFPAQQVDRAGYLQLIDDLAARFTADWIAQWQACEVDDGQADPVFLVGFPRSGTTLLDTILRSHRAIAVLEEKPTISELENALRRLPGGYPDGLAMLDSEQLLKLRQVYFRELKNHLEPGDRSLLVVDKQPLNLVHAGLIHRVFPRARFLFAQRHPCDCVFSSFMRAFKPNAGMVNFLELEDAARFYERTMSLWKQYLAEFPLSVHTVCYEELVEGFEETLGPTLKFLGVEWDDGIHDYIETAKRRGQITTPSYNQVTQPLYTHASGRWKQYREYLQPVLPVLLPWAKRLGYSEEA
ncbi:MAG: sulfotransferase [Gammaproteobacteria bacterium]|nr:sulfotransferase [Gammaproteobacteria bacterium]